MKIAPRTDPPTAEEVAVAMAAIALYMTAEQQSEQRLPASGWHASIKLLQQRAAPLAIRRVPTWGTIERLRRT